MSRMFWLLALAAGFQVTPAYLPSSASYVPVYAAPAVPSLVAVPAPAYSPWTFAVPLLAGVVVAGTLGQRSSALAVSGKRASAPPRISEPQAQADAPAGSSKLASVVFDPKAMPGACAPLGFFDPLGFSKDASPETMAKFREAELKHGRVAMLASLGMIAGDATSRWPRVFEKFSNNPLEALTQTPKLGTLQILTFIMFIEVLGVLNTKRPDYKPGDFLGSAQWETDKNWESYQLKELNNGRLAMFGSIGMLTGSYITGQGPIEVITSS